MSTPRDAESIRPVHTATPFPPRPTKVKGRCAQCPAFFLVVARNQAALNKKLLSASRHAGVISPDRTVQANSIAICLRTKILSHHTARRNSTPNPSGSRHDGAAALCSPGPPVRHQAKLFCKTDPDGRPEAVSVTRTKIASKSGARPAAGVTTSPKTRTPPPRICTKTKSRNSNAAARPNKETQTPQKRSA